MKIFDIQYFFQLYINLSFIIPTKMKKILCLLTVNPDFVQFAIPQLKSLLHNAPYPLQVLFQDELKDKQFSHPYQINHKLFTYFPFIILNVPNYNQHKQYFENLCKEAVMIYKMIVLISSGDNYQELFKNGDGQILEKECRNDQEIVACDFYSHNRVLPRQDQISNMHQVLGKFDIRGKINFKTAKIRYILMQQHKWYQFHHKDSYQTTLRKIYFGIELCSNKIITAKFNNKYQLNKRIYLGPTSTDNDLAFMMCNQALINKGSIIIDPFVGTGGLLIPPASKGAITFGSDLDIRVINGYSVGRINKKSPYYKEEMKYQVFTPKINLNFQQYQFDIPNIIRIDSTRLAFREGQFFDAIITDPPYGIRAMSRTVSKKNQKEEEIKEVVELQGEKVEELNEGEKESDEEIEEKQEEKQLTQQEKPQETQQQKENAQTAELQKQRKRQKRKILKENKRKRRQLLPEQQKQFKQNLMKKLNRQRVDQWQKYDKGKIQATQRQKIFQSLLQFSKKYLRKGGRLVFLYPIYEQQEYLGVQNLPSHEGFVVIDLSQNKMSKGNSRILVTMQKL